MARRVLSILRAGPSASRAGEPAVEANAYAVAEDIDLTILLGGEGVELGVATAELPPAVLAGVALPPVAPAEDLRALLESGVAVYAAADDLAAAGLEPTDLVEGVRVVDDQAVTDLVRDADAVIVW